MCVHSIANGCGMETELESVFTLENDLFELDFPQSGVVEVHAFIPSGY